MTTIAHSYPLTMPSAPAPRTAQYGLLRAIGATQSPFTFDVQVQKHQGAVWLFDLEYPPMTQAQAALWEAFLLKMQGRYGTCYVPHPDRQSPAGTVDSAVTVSGGSQTGNQVDLTGFDAFETGLKAGDVIQIGDYLYQVVDDATADSSGGASVNIEPSLRASPANGASVTYNDAKTKCRLASNDVRISTNEMKVYGLSLQFVEAL